MDDGVRGGMGDGVAAVATNAVPEEESDDEYEQIPARKEKQRRVDSPEKSLASGSLSLQLKEENVVSDAKAQAPAVEGSAESKEATKPNAETQEAVPEDDDWLRSRTNRLLDLVDPDDLERTPVQGPSTTETDHAEGGDAMEITPADPPAPSDVSIVETTVEVLGDEPAKDDTLESIRRTSRLFVRNLPYSATQEDLRAAFEQFGTLEEVCFKQDFLPFILCEPMTT